MKDILKTMLVLSIIALVAGGLLGIVNHFTQIDEDEALAAKIEKTGIYSGDAPLVCLAPEVCETYDEYEDGAIINVFVGGNSYIIHSVGYNGYGGNIELLINITDNEIVKYVVYKAEETPGLGTKAFADAFASQFYNKDIRDIQSFVVIKRATTADNEITAVTGATKSSNGVANSVNAAIAWYIGYTEVTE